MFPQSELTGHTGGPRITMGRGAGTTVGTTGSGVIITLDFMDSVALTIQAGGGSS